MKRRSFTLVEWVIALSLTALFLPLLLQLYMTLEEHSLGERALRRELFEERLLESRLLKLFAGAQKGEKKNGTIFFTDGDSLVFVTDRGVDYDPFFANNVLCRLFLDDKKRFCAAFWPLPERWKDQQGAPPMHLEVLAENVEKLSFSFFAAPTQPLQKTIIGERQVIKEGLAEVEVPEGKWINEWDRRIFRLPALIQVSIIQKEEQKGKEEDKLRTFYYVIPQGTEPIIYRI